MVNIITAMQERQQQAEARSRQEQAMSQIQSQNSLLVNQLQAQADSMRAETTRRTAELAEARAPVTTTVNPAPYSVATGQGTAGGAQEQTTTTPAHRKKPKATLQLGAEISLPGVGINLGGG